MESQIRWKQRFSNVEKAFEHLKFAVTKVDKPSDLQKDGTIQRFEFTHELAWKVMKDYLEYEGISGISGSRSATREAFNKGLLTNGNAWMEMIESRNRTVHTYIDKILENEYKKIVSVYFSLIDEFYEKMKTLL